MKNLKLLLVVLVNLISGYSFAGLIYSNGTGGGDWNVGTTWDPQGVPGCGDTIVIRQGDIVTINSQTDYSACGSPIYILVRGTMSFPGNGPKLRLPCGSAVYISNTGLITANGSNGNSNNIVICGVTEWSAGDGDIDTPTIDTLGVIPTGLVNLSITLVEFSAINVEEINKLTWIVSSEINNAHYEVERTVNGYEFVSVGTVAGAGNYSGELTYSMEDQDFELNRINYYRLKWVDFDGLVEYSDLISVDNTGVDNNKVVKTYNLLGQPVNSYSKGIVIDVYSDGKTVKRYIQP